MAVRSGRSCVGKDSTTFCTFARRYQAWRFRGLGMFFCRIINTIINPKTGLSWIGMHLESVYLRDVYVCSCSDPTCMFSCWTSAPTERLIFASEEIDPHLSPRPLWLLCHTGRSDENSVWPSPSPLRSPASSIAVANNSEFHNSSRKATIREKSFLFDNLIVQTNHLADTGHSSPHKQTKTRPFP